MSDQPSSSSVSRRSITRGAAWSLPAIAVGAVVPAFGAASPTCANPQIHTITWGTKPSGTLITDTTYTPTGSATTLSTSASGSTGGNLNLRVRTAATSGISLSSVDISLPSLPNAGQTVTFSFSQPVSNLTFTLGDIDRANIGRENVGLSPSNFVVSDRGSVVTGAGTTDDPFVGTAVAPNGGKAGNVTVTYNSLPISSFTLRLANANNSGISIFPLTFTGC